MPGHATEKLQEYRRKRDFRKTLEPAGDKPVTGEGNLYVMHRHAASHDHFDLRLEQDGVLRSWALPKGASLEPGEKRLAVEVEDHPLEYGGFEGVIPKKEYGGGTVMLWDAGEWRPNGKQDENHLDFILNGRKLKGAWTLVRTRGGGKRAPSGKSWLLIKRSDERRRRLSPGDESILSGRSMEEIARDADNTWIRGRAVQTGTPRPKQLAGARRKKLPEKPAPQLATLVDSAPEGDQWIHEIKLDGYRLLARLQDGEVQLLTRNGHDWTHRFATIARELENMPLRNAILDGEAVAMTNDGASSFRQLQEALSRKRTEHLVYQVFDLLYLDGHDLAGAGLLDRKHALQRLLGAAGFGSSDRIRYSDHIRGQGPSFYEQVCSLGLEGIISKRIDAPYRSGRSRHWLKTKCTIHQEFVVGGYTPPAGSRSGFGSLLLGGFRNGTLVYAGRVGTGFSAHQLDALHAALQERETRNKPFAGEVLHSREAHWVHPELVVEVEFSERTRDGRLRHPVFRGLREDREASEIGLDEAIEMNPQAAVHGNELAGRRRKTGDAEVAGVRITHPDRVMYPEQGVTKLDLARYYEDIGDWILPYLANRPLSLLRCPEGRQTECFFQKHPGHALAKNVPRVSIEESKGAGEYVYVNAVSHIVALVQAGVLEFHPWGSLVDDVDRPDIMVFDLDPAPGVSWKELQRATRELHERLQALGLPGFLRTTGGKGLHIVVPLKPKAGWDEVKDFAKAVAEQAAKDDSSHLTVNMAKSKRKGRIFIDYLRNGRGNTAIASYSVRAREGAPVAVPVRWDELNAALRPDRYNIENVRRRLGALKQDPWEGFLEARTTITSRMRSAAGLK